MRGEHICSGSYVITSPGSSPRARGTLSAASCSPRKGRIIPACAGNTVCGLPVTLFFRDHPRVRGEHGSSDLAPSGSSGSSPRARGTRDQSVRFVPEFGIIPACAGNTLVAPAQSATPRDHPRVRGEHRPGCGARAVTQGSSPRARGTLAYYER